MNIPKIGMMGRTYRHLSRYRQILAVLFKYGFGDLVDRLRIDQYLEIGMRMISRKREVHPDRHTHAERLRMALVDLGPTFIKLGQMLSTRPDLISVEFINELSKLQDRVPPFPFAEAREILETSLKRNPDELFDNVEEAPFAAASIAQVHRATLKDGDPVVVKIQRPKVRKTIEVDLEILLHLASLMERHLDKLEFYQPVSIVEEFSRNIERELDFNIEASHMERFALQFMGDDTTYVPKVYRNGTTDRVLTMEFIDGIKASEIGRLAESGLDLKRIAERGAASILKQAFAYGFFHADPHPGNILILPKEVVCFVDYGQMGRIDLKTREGFSELVLGVVRRDQARVADALLQLTFWDSMPDRPALEGEIATLTDKHFYRPLKDLNLGKVIMELLEITSKHGMRLDPSLFLMLKAIGAVEGLGRKLDPDFEISSQLEPFLKKIRADRLRPRRLAADAISSGAELLRLLREIPREISDLLDQTTKGRLKVDFEHRGLKPLVSGLDRVSNRIASAIVLAALLIASSLIVLANVPPRWHEIPVIGIAGYLLAGVMGLWLLLSTLRGG